MFLAKEGDMCIGICSDLIHLPGTIMIGKIIGASGSPMTVDGMPVACMGDMVLGGCGHVGTIVGNCATNTTVNGKPAARMGSVFAGVYSGTVISTQSKMSVQK